MRGVLLFEHSWYIAIVSFFFLFRWTTFSLSSGEYDDAISFIRSLPLLVRCMRLGHFASPEKFPFVVFFCVPKALFSLFLPNRGDEIGAHVSLSWSEVKTFPFLTNDSYKPFNYNVRVRLQARSAVLSLGPSFASISIQSFNSSPRRESRCWRSSPADYPYALPLLRSEYSRFFFLPLLVVCVLSLPPNNRGLLRFPLTLSCLILSAFSRRSHVNDFLGTMSLGRSYVSPRSAAAFLILPVRFCYSCLFVRKTNVFTFSPATPILRRSHFSGSFAALMLALVFPSSKTPLFPFSDIFFQGRPSSLIVRAMFAFLV